MHKMMKHSLILTSCHYLGFPFARSGHRAIADDDYVYIIGGYNADFNDDDEQLPLFRYM